MSKEKMSSTELGALWTTHQKKTVIMRMLEYFIETADDPKAKNLMAGLHLNLSPLLAECRQMLEDAGAALPVGLTKEDVNVKAPKLYTNGFDIMFCRVLKEISMGMYVLHMTTSYREDIVDFYKRLTDLTQSYYNFFTQYLLENDLLPRPTYVNMPMSVDFITDAKYIKGTNLFGHKRPLNTVEFGLLYHTLSPTLQECS